MTKQKQEETIIPVQTKFKSRSLAPSLHNKKGKIINDKSIYATRFLRMWCFYQFILTLGWWFRHILKTSIVFFIAFQFSDQHLTLHGFKTRSF